MASSISTEELAALCECRQVIDVRRPAVFNESAIVLADAVWRDPGQVADWQQTLERDNSVVVYCVHGHRVGKDCATALEQRGFAVRYLEGGVEQWASENKPMILKPEASTTCNG